MARKKKQRRVEGVEIIDIGDKGLAIGLTTEREIVMLDRAIPGDIVSATLFKKRKGVWQGRVDEVTDHSPDTVTPLCKHFGVCGGCKWQDLSYQKQLYFKQKHVTDALTRIAKVDVEGRIEPILGCEEQYYYRNKMEYAFSNQAWMTQTEIDSGKPIDERDALGFHKAGVFYKVVDITECHLQDQIGDEIRNEVRKYAHQHKLPFFDIRGQHGLLRNLLIRTSTLGEIMVLVSFYQDDKEAIAGLMNHLAKTFPQITSLLYIINPKGNDTIYDLDIRVHSGKDFLEEKLGDVHYKIGPKSFFQTNSKQAKRLFDIVKEFSALTGSEVVYDLYTGIGSIALYLASQSRVIIGIETIEAAITDAKENASFNQIDNAHFYAGDVKDVFTPELVSRHGSPDLVVTDPPRAGMSPDVVNFLLELSPPNLVYISCNPSTQARDLGLLKERYHLVKSRAVDMFPHTSHVENVILLKRREK